MVAFVLVANIITSMMVIVLPVSLCYTSNMGGNVDDWVLTQRPRPPKNITELSQVGFMWESEML